MNLALHIGSWGLPLSVALFWVAAVFVAFIVDCHAQDQGAFDAGHRTFAAFWIGAIATVTSWAMWLIFHLAHLAP